MMKTTEGIFLLFFVQAAFELGPSSNHSAVPHREQIVDGLQRT